MPIHSPPLGRNDSFSFDCRLCGQCCSGTMKVFLNPHDILVLAGHLGFDRSSGLWDAGYVVTDRGQQGLLLPRIRFAGHRPGFCPFVINDWNQEENTLRALCSLQDTAKPLICRLAPAARQIDFESPEKETWRVELPVAGCPGGRSDKRNLLDLYLAPLRKELDMEEEFFRNLMIDLNRGFSPETLLEKYFSFPIPPVIS